MPARTDADERAKEDKKKKSDRLAPLATHSTGLDRPMRHLATCRKCSGGRAGHRLRVAKKSQARSKPPLPRSRPIEISKQRLPEMLWPCRLPPSDASGEGKKERKKKEEKRRKGKKTGKQAPKSRARRPHACRLSCKHPRHVKEAADFFLPLKKTEHTWLSNNQQRHVQQQGTSSLHPRPLLGFRFGRFSLSPE